jgi:hypothetical protein
MSLQVAAAMSQRKRAPCSNFRGAQTKFGKPAQTKIQGIPIPDKPGCYVKTPAKREKNVLRQQVRRANFKVAILNADKKSEAARTKAAVLADRKRKRKHTDKDAPYTAIRVAYMQIGQQIYTFNGRCINSVRGMEPGLEAQQQGFFPERSTVKRQHANIAAGAVQFMEPALDTQKVVLSFQGFMEELLRVSGTLERYGVDPDEHGLYKMDGMPYFGIAATADGARLWSCKKGMLIMAWKPWMYNITQVISGRLQTGAPTGQLHEGAQSSSACILAGFLAGADNTKNNHE